MFSGIRQRLKYAAYDAGALAGLNKAVFRNARGSRIVVYHGVCRRDHTRYNNIFLRLKTFERHLQYYKKYFHVVSLDDYYAGRFSGDRYNICISFDDGYENNYLSVLPLLEKYRVPAVFFITSIRQAGYDILWNDFIGYLHKYGPRRLSYEGETYRKGRLNHYFSERSGVRLVEALRSAGFAEKAALMQDLYPLVAYRERVQEAEYWRQMTETQIRELSESEWVTIGSHGFYHNDLGRIPIEDAERELTDSRLFLEKWTDKPVRSMAFPYGTYSRAAVAAASRAGYTQILALDFHFPEDRSDRAMRERFIVNPFISPENQMLATIKRTYAF
jgi:peptidoglycan/xylan/chitin deacetylase (PgdA/CDA1 family)